MRDSSARVGDVRNGSTRVDNVRNGSTKVILALIASTI